MIKLLDDLSLLEGLCEAEPYFGSIFSAAGASFLDDPELLSIWVEIDEHGKPRSYLNAGSDFFMLFSPEDIPGMEMMIFVTNLISSGGINHIECDRNSLSVLRNLFDFEISEEVQMKAENPVIMPENGFEVCSEYNFDDAYSVTEKALGSEAGCGSEFWMLRMVRGVLKGQTTLYTLYDNKKAVSAACIRGRTKNAGAITSVVTVPEHRCRGFASYLTSLCSKTLLDEHRTPWLVPADEKVRKMYEKLGFSAAKNYYSLDFSKKG